MYTLVKLILVASAIYVYHDATKNKIGRISGQSGFFNLPAGAWALGTLWLWLIFFPMYLIKREDLLQKAQEHPREASYINLKLGIFAFFFVALLLQGIGGGSRTADGQLIFKGLYLGMPVEEAAQVMLNYGLPPGGPFDDSPYEEGGPWDGSAPLQLFEGDENGSWTLRKSESANDAYLDMFSWWAMQVDANGAVTEVRLMADAVDVLFNTQDMDAEEFAQMFIDAYDIPEMLPTAEQTNDLERYLSEKFVKRGWEYVDREYGWSISISDSKTIKISSLTTSHDTNFN